MESKFKIDIKRMLIIASFMIITTIIVSGSTWLFVSLADRNVSQTRKVEIATLESQLTKLRQAVNTKKVFERNNQVLGSSKYSTN